ncbi:DUF4064 domain-containing protein [Staphylococcus auricularis]|uniref:DUF4064 domain-containing protein n=1 Tax=Staphylococcus auricularis TaxID=29379 RepID=UPI003F7983F2
MRKAERVLGWIGVGIGIIFLVFIGFALIGFNQPGFEQEFNDLYQEEAQIVSFDTIKSLTTVSAILLLVSTVLGLIATLLVKKKRILSGALFMAAFVVGILFGNWLAGILWLIAGIMMFVRKDSDIQGEGTANEENPFIRDEVHTEGNPYIRDDVDRTAQDETESQNNRQDHDGKNEDNDDNPFIRDDGQQPKPKESDRLEDDAEKDMQKKKDNDPYLY